MPDQRIDDRMDDMDERLREAEKTIFNGLRDACAKMTKWLDEKAPHLLTREEHAKIDEDQAADIAVTNREIGRKKDRRLVIIGFALPFLTAGAIKLLDLL